MFYDKIKGMNTSTTRSITYNGDTIEYELTIKRVKNINMRVHKDGSVHVSANAYVPDHRIDAFVIENIPFIERARFNRIYFGYACFSRGARNIWQATY